jgi:hypothetical protein
VLFVHEAFRALAARCPLLTTLFPDDRQKRQAHTIRWPSEEQHKYKKSATSGSEGETNKAFAYFVVGSAASFGLVGAKAAAYTLVSTMSASGKRT